MRCDADFIWFFENTFQRRLHYTEIPGMPRASWDRRAAYLLWKSEGKPGAPSTLLLAQAEELDDEMEGLL